MSSAIGIKQRGEGMLVRWGCGGNIRRESFLNRYGKVISDMASIIKEHWGWGGNSACPALCGPKDTRH